MQNTIKIKESFNKDILNKLITVKHHKIKQEQFNLLLKLQKYKGKSYFVNYTKSQYNDIPSGRYFARSKASIQSLQRELRGLLCKDLFVDVDMKNSNYIILENLAKKHNISHQYLEEFNKLREQILQTNANLFNLTRDDMKELYSSIFCGGSIQTWMKKHNVHEIPQYANNLNNEIIMIRNELLDIPIYKHYINVARASKKDNYNILGTALSFILQDIESQILLCFVDRAKKQHKIQPGVLMHDGCLFYYNKDTVIPDYILRDLEKHVLDSLGYQIQLVCKPHEINNDFIDDSQINHDELHDIRVNNTEQVMDEVYTQSSMRQYPMNKPIVLVKANPGVGKTVELENLTKQIPADKRILIVSYNVTLCKKYHATFEKYGFKLYNDMNYEDFQNQHRIIICLDSIYKIPLNNDEFDYVFIDECLSVFEHFSSSVMREVTQNIDTLTSILMQTKYMYLIDANVDSNMIVDSVKWLEKKKDVKSYWIHNQFLRETNRKVHFMNNNVDVDTQISHVISLLSKNKKVVCPCSSKMMVDTLYETASKLMPHLKVKKYNSESSRVQLYEDSLNPNEAWNDIDLLIYSPTISAGVSFEQRRFDVLVGFFESSMSYASVNNCFQQLFRVRQLIDGDMYIYTNCLKYYNLATTSADVEKQLDKNISGVSNVLENCNKFLELNPSTYKRGYNKKQLSYQIIKNIVLSKNQSLMYFKSILKNALTDNGIPYQNFGYDKTIQKVTIFKSTEDKDLKQEFIDQFQENKKELVLNRNEMVNTEKAISGGKIDVPKPVKVKRLLTINLYNWNSNIEKITLDFFKEHVLTVNDIEQKSVNAVIACGHRYNRLDKPLKDDYKRLYHQFDSDSDNNFKMFKNVQKTGHRQTIFAKNMLIEVFGAKEGSIKEYILDQKFKDKNWKPNLVKYLRAMSKEEYFNMLTMFKLHIDNSYSDKKTTYKRIENFEIERSKLPSGFVRTVMKQTFHIDFVQSTCKNYMLFDNTFWEDIAKNNVTFLTNSSRFVEDPCDMDSLEEFI